MPPRRSSPSPRRRAARRRPLDARPPAPADCRCSAGGDAAAAAARPRRVGARAVPRRADDLAASRRQATALPVGRASMRTARRLGSRSPTVAARRCCRALVPARRERSSVGRRRRCKRDDRQRGGNAARLSRSADRPRRLHARQRGPSRTQVANSMRDDRSPLDAFVRAGCVRRRAARARRACAGATRVVTVGGDAPVRVQSMTNTDTADAIGDRDPGHGAGDRRLGDGAHHRQHARGGARRCRTSASSSTAWASTCR